MQFQPPQGSTITVSETPGGKLITIPHAQGSWGNVGVGLFMLAWLGGWVFGEIMVITQLVSTPPRAGHLFLLFWLAAWTVGGVFAMLTIRRLFQKSQPETILMNASGIVVNSGIPPYQPTRNAWFGRTADQKSDLRFQLWPKHVTDTIESRSLTSLRLRELPDSNRLTVDVGARRLELAKGATDIEREWLFRLFADRYRLPKPIEE